LRGFGFCIKHPPVPPPALHAPSNSLNPKCARAAAAGAGPDLFIAPNDSLGTEARANLLLDLDQYLEGQLDDMLEVAVDGSKVDGTLYAVPESLKAVAVFYNSSVVDEAPATTDALLAAVGDGLRLGINQNPYHNWGFWYAFGGQIMDDSGTCVADQGGVTEAFAYLQDLKAAGAKFYTDGAAFQDDFKTGNLDIIVEGPWFTGDAKEALGDDLAVAPMPAGPGGPSQPMTGVDGWYVNANTSDPDLAVAFALEMIKLENEQVMVDKAGHIPAHASIEIADPITSVFAQAVADGFARPQSEELNNYWGNFGNELNLLLDDNKDPAQAVADACSAMNVANGK
jgi:arabinogalactan oligomer / maltooligosaccharide transport system substrate-binding protein